MESYHNSLALQGAELHSEKRKALSMNERVLSFFRRNRGRKFTPIQCLDALKLKEFQIVSVRRAISNLSNPKFYPGEPPPLIKTNDRIMERFGSINHKWTFNNQSLLHQAKQTNLFG